jgi:hypothetical protein
MGAELQFATGMAGRGVIRATHKDSCGKEICHQLAQYVRAF